MKPMETALEIMKKEYNAIGTKWKFRTDESIPCPFHPNEVKPKQTFKYFQKDMRYFCSACEHGGSVSDFVQKIKKLDGTDIKLYLRQVYQYGEKPRKKLIPTVVKPEMPEDESLFLPQIVNIAHENLKLDSPAYKLLLEQGVSPKTIKQEKIGYFGSTAKDIAHLLRDFPKKELYRLGILTHKKNTLDEASPFEGQVIVPLYHNGIVIDLRGGFQDKKVSLLHQSNLPIALGRKAEPSKEIAIIAKGLTDYLTLIENGFNAKLIDDADHDAIYQSFDAFKQVFICLDNSPSGRNKAMKITRRILEETKHSVDSVEIMVLPEGKDTKALFLSNKGGFRKQFTEIMQSAMNLIDFQISMNKANSVRELIDDLHQFAGIADHESYLIKISEKLDTSYEAVEALYRKSMEVDKHSIFAGLTDKEELELYPAQDYHDGQMYYSFMNDKADQLFVFRSDRQHFSTFDGAQYGLRFRHHSLDKNMVKRHYVEDFICAKVKEVDCLQLYEDIMAYLQRYVYLPDQRLYTLSAIWTMNTYIYKGFEAVAYLWLNGDKGTGKTRFRDVMSQICFNSLAMDSTATAPVIFRNSEQLQPTLFIDEFENMKRDMSSQLKAILNTGYKKGSSTSRMHRESKEKESRSKGYGTYCPKVFLGIDSDMEGTLHDTDQFSTGICVEKPQIHR